MRAQILTITFLSGALLAPFDDATAADATIIGIYENCRVVTSTVVVRPAAISGPQAERAVAEAESIAAGASDFEQALPAMVRALERHGIRETEITRRGFRGCEPPSSGKYVEALGSYCNGQLTSAEILVDGKLFLRRSNPGVSLESFVDEASAQLKNNGIWDRPRVSLGNDADCREAEDAPTEQAPEEPKKDSSA